MVSDLYLYGLSRNSMNSSAASRRRDRTSIVHEISSNSRKVHAATLTFRHDETCRTLGLAV